MQEPMMQDNSMDGGMQQNVMDDSVDMGGIDETPQMDDNGEESEDKKDIQRLSGELSQKLVTYNQQQQDDELNKYVAGMIIPQTTKNLDSNAKQDIVNKIEKNENEDGGENMMPTESYNRLDELVNEIVDSMISNRKRERSTERDEKKITNTKVRNDNPFVSNR